MNKTPWTDKETEQFRQLYKAGKTFKEIAKTLGRSIVAVENKADRIELPIRDPNGVLASYTAEPVQVEDKNAAFWREEAHRLTKQVAQLSKQQTATEILADEARALAPRSYQPAPFSLPPRLAKRGNSSPQSAVLMLSDTHVGAVVKPTQTLGFGEYNFTVFLQRLKRLEMAVFSIMSDHTTTDVPEIIVPLLGDMIDGALQHSAEAGQVNTLFSQFYGAGHALAQFLRNVSAMAPKIRVYTCVGNHPRWQNQHKMPTKNRFSNLDQFLYAYIQALVRDIPSIEFHLDRQPWAEFKVQGFTFLAAHGDHLRGGDKALGIPSHAIGRNVSAAAQMRLKTDRPGVNYYLLGHLHRPMELPHSGGQVIVNGGFPGVDEFGLTESFVACDPVQKFFFVHPKHGRAACYDLNLKFGSTADPYTIPSEFPII